MDQPPEGNRALSVETQAAVFSRLKPFCVDLLDLLQNPKRSAAFLPAMADLLRRAPAAALQPCFDYTLFPLLLLLDAAVDCRKGVKSGSASDGPLRIREVSDSVAEGVLVCLEEVLKKCRLGSVNQMVVVLKKLTSGALLSPSEAAEEFREGIIRCLRAMLHNLQPCSMCSCSCKQTSYSSTMISITSLQDDHDTLKSNSESQECLLAFLRSKDASAAVGHWLSLLLQTAEVEAARGHRGSGILRKEAFLALRVLVAKVGTADALAFFLPGTVSRFTKALYASKSMISGAAGNTGSIEHAIHGLAEFLMIVLNDEANIGCLEISSNNNIGFHQSRSESTVSVLEALRSLPVNAQNQSKALDGDSFNHSQMFISTGEIPKTRSYNEYAGTGSLYVHRTKEWLDETSAHVDKLLSATFPALCLHPAEIVRKALVDGIKGILTNCSLTLKKSKLMLLECLCILVCDESEAVSVVGQESLESLFILGRTFLKENEVSEIFTSFIGRLPRVVLGSEETVAISHARRVVALLYYAGPELVVDHLLRSPVSVARFLDVLGITLGHNAQYAGSIDKLISSKPLSVGYLLSISELKACSTQGNASHIIDSGGPNVISKVSVIQDYTVGNIGNDFDFPRMPPWFAHVGSQKLYLALSGILRLTGLSLLAGNRSDVSLSVLVDALLDYFRKLISELRMREYNKESWRNWYSRSASGLLVRQTSVAVCMLNEIIYGLSDQSISSFSKLFRKARTKVEGMQGNELSDDQPCVPRYGGSAWMICQGKDSREHIIQCVGSILHEYLSPEVWSLPVDQKLEHDTEADLPLHFLRDTTMLHQVIIDGIGIFGVVLEKDFIRSGFMHSSLYLLLQNLICSSSQIRSTSDAVLRMLSSSSGHATVGHLVMENADYIIDYLCRQLRHLDLNPHVADVLAAILSFIGATQEILPLLEEPMRAISSELEVLGRHHHPHLTVPFLKAVSEISKASRREALRLPKEAVSFYEQVSSLVSSLQRKGTEENIESFAQKVVCDVSQEGSHFNDFKVHIEFVEELLFKLNEMRRYRRIIGSLIGSCLKAAAPLLSSLKEYACLLALDIIEDVTLSLAKVEEAYKHENETKMAIERAIQLFSFNDIQDTMDTADEEADENRLLPAMNKTWPFLVLCIKNKISVAVVRRCTIVLSSIVQISGGDFFARRFHQDGSVIWKLLIMSPFWRKPSSLKDERAILLPYRSTSVTSENKMAEVSSLKIQAAVLNMIAEISSNKRSASALRVVLKKVSGLVVGVACGSLVGLHDASIRALSGLACIDPDLIWLLLADLYFSLKNKDSPPKPTSDLAGLSELLPPPSSSKDYLYVQYGGESFDIDSSAVEVIFRDMQSQVFT